MKPEEQRIAIATACGIDIEQYRMEDGGINVWPIPDYLNDLNAMHEAEKLLQQHMEKWWNYASKLAVANSTLGHGGEAHATATQRAEAFLHTLNLWTDDT